MRLTSEILAATPSFLNPINDRELDLRGHKIPAIENLGVAGPQDAIDFTDNDIQQLGNFPLSERLHTLLLARNRISVIQPTLVKSIPNLTVLILTANNLSELGDLEPLSKFRRLVHLSLLENPVTRKDHYRHWVIWKCPTVRFLDYQKVKDVERKRAEELFGTEKEPSPLASKIMGIKSRTFDLGESSGSGNKEYAVRLTAAEKKKIEDKIRAAKSLEEIARLEKVLREGPSADLMEE
ncbi:leucine-rich repeat-domain-containing protein [Tricharina praecox]|uniref:leucine-rich repeat-domain-containing protein n=1 Tax=Tricharina praecox TaxID=43433 RepID=UPI002220C735|nr:leucine-rich repeat-domain-containing protein [Tricharina praecox]KAI5846047.1 leucine-rich repeat-domain-containing protein [Tricharina praecox]